MPRIQFEIGDVRLEAELADTPTAHAILEALPITSSGNYWGGEFYFEIPVQAGEEPGATDVLDAGAIAYWPPGRCLCLFWGPTPASEGKECRAASKVNVVGRVLNPEALPTLKGRQVKVA